MTKRESALRNVQAIAAKRRAATHCKRGHLITGKRKDGRRYCLVCFRDSNARYAARKKAQELLAFYTAFPNAPRQ